MPPLSSTSSRDFELPERPSFTDVVAASERLAGIAVRTPLLESPALDRLAGGRVLVKAEVLQRTGSFKFRGAYNRISQLDPVARRRGVVAFSSGNHAQGVAYAAALCGVPACIVMPADAPAVKRANTRGYGAEVVLFDRKTEDREAIARRLVEQRGATLVPPYDDPDIIAGQGTVGLEIAGQCRELGISPAAVIAPASGGGLIAGLSLALRGTMPDTPVYVAEPAGFDDHGRSLASGRRESNAAGPRSMCDALLAIRPGELTFSLNRHLLAGAMSASDAEVEAAMAAAFLHLKLVVEPGGAVALACALGGGGLDGRTVIVVASGGNVDPALFAEILARGHFVRGDKT